MGKNIFPKRRAPEYKIVAGFLNVARMRVAFFRWGKIVCKRYAVPVKFTKGVCISFAIVYLATTDDQSGAVFAAFPPDMLQLEILRVPENVVKMIFPLEEEWRRMQRNHRMIIEIALYQINCHEKTIFLVNLILTIQHPI